MLARLLDVFMEESDVLTVFEEVQVSLFEHLQLHPSPLHASLLKVRRETERDWESKSD